ncbi:hypothetical protein V8C34DRAFT_283311, partial [Trichoderma compactum]
MVCVAFFSCRGLGLGGLCFVGWNWGSAVFASPPKAALPLALVFFLVYFLRLSFAALGGTMDALLIHCFRV